jgi:hypothetical protein
MLRDKPTFAEPSELARYIPSEWCKRKNRPASAAYQRKDNEEYLSVNSTEVETINQIAQTYATKFESGTRPVAIACPKVASYNEAADKVGIAISFNGTTNDWEFQEGGKLAVAYKHRRSEVNNSHCGVEFVRVFDDRSDFCFAVRVARSATYKTI